VEKKCAICENAKELTPVKCYKHTKVPLDLSDNDSTHFEGGQFVTTTTTTFKYIDFYYPDPHTYYICNKCVKDFAENQINEFKELNKEEIRNDILIIAGSILVPVILFIIASLAEQDWLIGFGLIFAFIGFFAIINAIERIVSNRKKDYTDSIYTAKDVLTNYDVKYKIDLEGWSGLVDECEFKKSDKKVLSVTPPNEQTVKQAYLQGRIK